MMGSRSLSGTGLLAVSLIACLAILPAASAASVDYSKWCNCGTTYSPVCGLDGQTWANNCVRQCAAVPTAYKGKCEPGCYPYGESKCSGYPYNKQQICVYGLTFTSMGEAKCGGSPAKDSPKCYQKGVCKYNIRNGNVVSYNTTPKGRGGSVASAAKNTKPLSRSNARYSYSEALTKALIFFDSMVSGRFENAGHRRLKWRKNSCQECKGRYGEDLSQGFYEAGGSSLKFPLINSYMTTILAWGALENKAAYQKTKNWNDVRWKVKWGADYLLKSYVKEGVFAGLAGNDTLDFDYFGPPEKYNQFVKSRPVGYITKASNRKGSEVLADSAAALAAASMLLKDKHADWAASALKKARSLYEWARTNPGSYMNNQDPVMKIHAKLYGSNGFWDELSWAAYWLHRATGRKSYLDHAKSYYAKASAGQNVFELNNKRPALSVLMANSRDSRYRKDAINYFDSYLNQYQQHTNRGLAYPYHWGAARHGPNVAFLAMTFAKKAGVPTAYKNRLRNYAIFQINYLLGDSGRSWVVGFGKGYTRYLWHKASYNSYLDWDPALATKVYAMPDPGPWSSSIRGSRAAYVEKGKLDFESSRYPQRRIAYGTLMTPLVNDHMIVSRKDYTYMEPTIEYQAGFTGALAAFAGWYNQGVYNGAMKDVLARP